MASIAEQECQRVEQAERARINAIPHCVRAIALTRGSLLNNEQTPNLSLPLLVPMAYLLGFVLNPNKAAKDV